MSKARFQIPPRAPSAANAAPENSSAPLATPPVAPVSRLAATRQFVDGAAMVQSQAGEFPVKPKRLNVDLDPLEHQRLKVAAAAANVSMADLIREWVREKLG